MVLTTHTSRTAHSMTVVQASTSNDLDIRTHTVLVNSVQTTSQSKETPSMTVEKSEISGSVEVHMQMMLSSRITHS